MNIVNEALSGEQQLAAIENHRSLNLQSIIAGYPDPDTGEMEIGLILVRHPKTSTTGRNTVIIPLSIAHTFCSYSDKVNGQEVQDRADSYCDALFGEGNWNRFERNTLADIVLKRLNDLVAAHPPKDTRIEKMLESARKANLSIEIEGETVFDVND